MAEKETDESLENDPLDDDSLNIAPKASNKPILIKIIIGLLVLLVAGGVYLFFMSSNESTIPVENTPDINEKIIPPKTTLPATTSKPAETKGDTANTIEKPIINKVDSAEHLEMLKMRKETAALKEENLKIKEQLKTLEAKLADVVKADKQINEKTAKPKVKIKSYNDLYVGNNFLIRPTQPKQPKAEKTPEAPPPEPKWGNFDPLYSEH